MNTPVSTVPRISFRRAGLLLFAASLLLTVGGVFPGNPLRQEPTNQSYLQSSQNPAPRVTLLSVAPLEAAMEDRRSDAFPDTLLTDQHGKTHRFRSDLVRDRVVCIMFFYTECQGTCPTSIRNMAELRDALYGEFSAKDLTFISVTLDPENDTPTKLKEYAEALELRTDDALAEWIFCTGEASELDTLRRSLGLYEIDPKLDADRSQHAALLTFGNDRTDRWTAIPGGIAGEDLHETFLRIAGTSERQRFATRIRRSDENRDSAAIPVSLSGDAGAVGRKPCSGECCRKASE